MAKQLNKNVTDKNRAAVIKELERREATGKIGKNDAARLAALRSVTGQPAAGQPVQKGVNDSINTNTGQITNPDDVMVSAGKVFDPNDPYWKDLYQNTYNTQYALSTSGLAERQKREVEEARQIAAERGLPYDPNTQGAYGDPNTAYGKQVQGKVVDRYDQMYKDADNAAKLAAQSAYEAQGSLVNDAYIKHIQAVLGISEADARVYANKIAKEGIDKDYKAKMAAVAASGKKSGGGSSSGGSGGGFDVQL